MPLHEWITASAACVRVSALVDPVAAGATGTPDDRTIRARDTLPAALDLVTLAPGAVLDASAWLKEIGSELPSLREELQQLSPTLRLALALLYERARGAESHLAGYIAQLPARIPLPMVWSDHARRRLQRTAAAPLVDAELVVQLFERFAAPLARKFPALWAADELTLARFQWAYAVVSSRAFTVSGAAEPALLPVIDMANHDHADPAAKIVRADDGSFQLVTLRAVEKDDAVTISYGDLSNAELLCRYGFVLPESVPSDCILVTSDELLATYAAFLNDDEDNVSDAQSDGVSDGDGVQEQEVAKEPAAKKRRVFAEKKSAEGDALVFLLHGRQEQEFGLGDALLSFVFARNLPAESLYDVLAVLLRKRDKAYSAVLERQLTTRLPTEEEELVLLLTKHERAVCRRILIGLLTLTENSSDEEEEEVEEEEEEGDDE